MNDLTPCFEPRRRFLLFSSVDTKRSAHTQWLQGPDRNYDVVLYVYRGEVLDGSVDLCVARKGFKYPNFYDFSRIYDVSHYHAVWIVDDDIQMKTQEINNMFDIFEKNDLWLAQPSFDSQSNISWDMSLVDERYHIRYTNFIENGVAVFSRDALKVCLPVMNGIKTGYGSDFLFASVISPALNGIAIIDAVQCHHPFGESSLDYEIPRSLHHEEARELMEKHDFVYFTPKVLGGVPS